MKAIWMLGVAAGACWTAAADAAEPVRLTSDGRQKSDLVFFDQGRSLGYVLEERSRQLCLWKLSLADGKAERVNPEANSSELTPSWSADGRDFAYVRNDGNLHVQLVIRDQTTGTQVEHNPGGGFAGIRYAMLAPDGGRVAYSFPETGQDQIFLLARDGSGRKAISDEQAAHVCPRWSPDGKWLACASTRDGNFDIFVLSADGKVAQQLTEHEALDSHPAWSPDGKRLAFTSTRDGNAEIYVMGADGRGLRRATTNPERDDFACWHPDGRRLALVRERGGKSDLWLIEAP